VIYNIALVSISAFISPPPLPVISSRKTTTIPNQQVEQNILLLKSSINNDGEDNPLSEEDGMLTTDENNNNVETIINNNWMKRSSSIDFNPVDLSQTNTNGVEDETIYMDIGINGLTFGTGDLSKRMHGALMKVASTKFGNNIPSDLINVYLLYAMDTSAKEAVKVAMDSNGYVLNLGDEEDMQDEGSWGQIDQVVLLDSMTNEVMVGEDGSSSYTSFMDAITKGGWEPGDSYSFIVREVPSRKKAMDLEALLKALDPDGTLWEEAKEQGLLLPGDEITSLKELGVDCDQRVKSAPFETSDEQSVFSGGESKGYNIISRKQLMKSSMNSDGTENQKSELIFVCICVCIHFCMQKCLHYMLTSLHPDISLALLHVMDSLANHGCLIVDLSNEDESTDDVITMSNMWDATSNFFNKADDENANLPPMQQAEGVGSSHAMVGFASFKDGDNQFLETRIRRSDGVLLPEETSSIIGEDGVQSMVDAFSIMSDVGKDIVRIATAASSVEADAFVTAGSVISEDTVDSPSIAGLSFEDVSGVVEESDEPSEEDIRRAKVLASDAAVLLTEEIMDDGKPLLSEDIEHDEGDVSMSPHRMCRYSNNNGDNKKKAASEIFGAHTDTSFVTIVPAAKVSGLEVFDEDSLQWYRPELNARKHSKRLGSKDDQFPWHARYLVVMPGELLQLTSRNNIPAVVHRVVAATDAPRLSAPVLLRARPGTKMDVERYMGSLETADSLLLDSNGMKMEEIHDSLQPSSK